MNRSIHTLTATVGMVVLAGLFPSIATAGCGAGPNFQAAQAPNLDSLGGADPDNHGAPPSIVGMWKTVFTSKGVSVVPGPPLPSGTAFEWGYVQWHSDNTEFFNSGDRQPTSQNFCMGVWEQTGPTSYKLNHFAYNYDPTTSVLVGKVNIREQITLERVGNKYTGTFTIKGWDMSGNEIVNIAGTLEAARVTVNTVDMSIP
jgi:hypothetical protein